MRKIIALSLLVSPLFLGAGDYLDSLKSAPALAPDPFPDRMSAYVWRNWRMVPVERLAKVVKATPENLTALAGEMGLKPQTAISSVWRRKGYIAVVKRNWHLLPLEQLLEVLDMPRAEFAYRIVEDDFLSGKLGHLKPSCKPLVWSAAEAAATREARRKIAAVLTEEGVDPNADEEPRFAFIDELSRIPRGTVAAAGGAFDLRMVYPYFAEYGDLLMDDTLSTLPEGLFAHYAEAGVNAVWLHVVLRTLVTDPAFPEFGEGAGRRRENLRRLVARAAKHGVRIYLYFNEPRCMGESFFSARPERTDMKGVQSANGRDAFAMCTSHPEVKRYLREGTRQLFSEVPGLGGVFTITTSENLTSCGSRAYWKDCPRCAKRKRADIIAEVNRLIADGMKAGDPNAELIVWDWFWPEGAEREIVPALAGTGARLMTVSEYGVPINRGGTEVAVNEYSLSAPGPSARAKDFWGLAQANGLKTVAKVQASLSWEFSPVPFLPVMDLVAEHAVGLAESGVNGVMMAWSLGGYPSPNLAVFREVRRGMSKDELLDRVAAQRYGAAAVPQVRRAWRTLSDGFREFPFEMMTAYVGPQHLGPVNPLYPKKTHYAATMVGYPYDDLAHWCSVYPEDVYHDQFAKVSDAFTAGAAEFSKVPDSLSGAAKAVAERDLGVIRAAELHFRSVVNQIDFVFARNRRGDRAAMRECARRELAVAKEFLPIVRADSRIGFEASNQYYYLPIDIVEKILTCRRIVDLK